MVQVSKTPRMYTGNHPDMDWEIIEIFGFEGGEWYLYENYEVKDNWRNLKLVANGRAESKANYWFAWNGKRINGSRDWVILKAGRIELQKTVLEFLKSS